MRTAIRVSALIQAVLLAGCISTPQSNSLLTSPPEGLESRVRLTHVPFFPQDDFQCGPAALATLLSAAGQPINPKNLVDDVYVPGKQGSYQLELITATRKHDRLPYQIAPSLEKLTEEIQAGNPVLVLQNLGLKVAPQWHFAVVKGYDLNQKTLLLNSGTIENYQMPLHVFERTWRRADYWAFVITPPERIPATGEADKLFSSLSALGKSTQAKPALKLYYRSALKRWPDDTNLQMGYGNLLYSMDNLQEAQTVFFKVTQQQPGFAPAFNNLAFTLYRLNRLSEAQNFAEKAVELGGDFKRHYAETYSMISDSLNTQQP